MLKVYDDDGEILLQGKSIKFDISVWKSCIILNYVFNQSFIYSPTDAFPISVYHRTVQHTDTNKDLIYAAAPPLY